MKNLLTILNDRNAGAAAGAAATAELQRRANVNKRTIRDEYVALSLKEAAVKKSETKVSFSDVVLGPVNKRMQDDERDMDDEMNEKTPRVVATPAADADPDEMMMDPDAATEDQGEDQEDELEDPKKILRTKSVPGHRSKVRCGISFTSVITPKSREYAIEDQPAREPRGTDDDADVLLRARESRGTMERIAGAFASSTGEPGAVPAAGSGETFEGTTQDIPTRQFQPMAGGEGDAGRVGGEDRGGRLAGPVHQYINTTGPVRVGDFAVMAPGNSGLADPADFKAPAPRESVLKDARPRGLFRNVVRGPEAGPSDGQS